MSQGTHGSVFRAIGAVTCGLVAGLLLPASMEVGARFAVASTQETDTWGVLWGEHWAVRTAASLAASFAAGIVTGLVARHRGGLMASIAAIPSVLLWAYLAVGGWTGHPPFLSADTAFDMSIGNKLAATVIALLTIPLSYAGGEQGESAAQEMAPYFDRRRQSLFGIRWYHYLWIPLVMHFVLAQTTWAGLYGFQWLMRAWKASMSMTSLLPTLFVLGVWGSLAISWTGVERAYRALSGFDDDASASSRTRTVIKHGIGFPLAAAALQALILLVHVGLLKLLS